MVSGASVRCAVCGARGNEERFYLPSVLCVVRCTAVSDLRKCMSERACGVRCLVCGTMMSDFSCTLCSV